MKTTKKKLHFIPVHQISSAQISVSDEYASFNPKYGMMTFSKEYVQNKGLENAFVRFFVDGPNKVIGWTKVTDNRLLEKDNKVKQIKSYNGGTYQVGLPKQLLMDAFGLTEDSKVVKRMAIRDYTDLMLGKVAYIEIIVSEKDEEDDD